MKKIMFNDKYGLTEAVLSGRKTMTRRIGDVKQQITQLESDEYPIPDFPEYINKIKEYIKEL